jgi:hypothetical protein
LFVREAMDLRRGPNMRYLRILGILALLAICLGSASFANAQRVVVGVGMGPGYWGPPPICAYGYYDYYPYDCAPYGFYGPDWFVGGVFIGAGPWFHGFRGFRGGPGFFRPGFRGPGFRGRGFAGRGFVGRGPGFVGRGGVSRGPVGGNFRGGMSGGFRGGSARGGMSGGSRGGGSRGGRR